MPTLTEEQLRRRQEEILWRLSQRRATKASVAAEMGLTERQVKRSLEALYRRLGVDSMYQAAAALGWLRRAA